eukprot:776243-Pleurochrysis_carterae.AAC.2
MGHNGGEINAVLPTAAQRAPRERSAPLADHYTDLIPVSAYVCVDIFKDQASVTALKDAVTVMEKMNAIIESENARSTANDKQ